LFAHHCYIAALCVLVTMIAPYTVYGENMLEVTDASSTPFFMVNDLGQVGIGTTPQQSQLYVAQSGMNTQVTRGIISAFHYDGTSAAVLQLKRSRGTEAAPTALLSGDNDGAIWATPYDGSGYQSTAAMIFNINGTVSTGSVPTDISFITGSATASRGEKMRITSAGNVGIGISNPTNPLQMASGAYVTTGGTWTNASSRDYKENITELNAADANVTLKGLNPVLFNYKNDREEKHVGFIAEDVPDMVATRDRKGLSAMDIVAVLTKVVQDQKSALELVTAKLEQLETEMARLKSRDMSAQK